ncbi:MAG: hypothetical protein LBQ32_05985, partial [Burkholderiaceae bacterium]|nr:hypothetical protein [Burkholderiaceae bacterium]
SALERLQAGDLCLILIDQVEQALAHIQQRVSAAAKPVVRTPVVHDKPLRGNARTAKVSLGLSV